MTEAAAPIEHVRPDVLPPITPAQAAAFQDACAAAAAIHSARELGVIARLTEAPADAAAVAADCGLTRQGAAAHPLSARRSRPPRARRRRPLSARAFGPRPARRAVQALGLSTAHTAWPAATGERGDNRRGGVPLSESRPTDRGSLPPKRRAGSQAARAARTPGARHRRRCCPLEPRHRRARAQFHRHGRGVARRNEEYAHRCSERWIRRSV